MRRSASAWSTATEGEAAVADGNGWTGLCPASWESRASPIARAMHASSGELMAQH